MGIACVPHGGLIMSPLSLLSSPSFARQDRILMRLNATGGTQPKAKTPPITVAQELHVDTDLRRLYESCGQLRDEVAPFMKRIKAELTRVREGDQEGVPLVPLFIHEKIPFSDVRLLFTVALPPYPYLRTIQLHHCEIGDDGALILAEFVRSYKPSPDKNPFGIECLEVPGCSIGPRGAGYLGKMLSENTTINKMSVDFNDLGDAGVKALCNGVRWNGSLHFLSLEYCRIGCHGASEIASSVIRCSNVKYLSLKGNAVGEVGVMHVARALSVGTSIEELNLCDVAFGTHPETLEALCEGMETSASLTSLNVDLNLILPSGMQALLTAVRRNKRITNVVLGERMEVGVYAEILDALSVNRKGTKKRRKKSKA